MTTKRMKSEEDKEDNSDDHKNENECLVNQTVKVFMRQIGLRGIMARDQYVNSLERLVQGLQEKVEFYERMTPVCCHFENLQYLKCSICKEAYTCLDLDFNVLSYCGGHEELQQCSKCDNFVCDDPDCVTVIEGSDEIICLDCKL